jgi:hypothetical protein
MRGLIFGLITIMIISGVTLILPNVYADDFRLETKCDGTTPMIRIVDQDGNGVENVKVLTIKGLTGTGGYEKKYFTDWRGDVKIPSHENTGYVWLQKGGFNDQKLKLEICSAIKIPQWIKMNAEWWVDGNIDEKTFLEGIKFLVKSKIIKVPPNTLDETDCIIYQQPTQPKIPGASPFITSCIEYQPDKKMPDWVKTNVEWWARGSTSDDTFVMGIQNLISQRIIEINDSSDSNYFIDSKFPSFDNLKNGIIDEKWTVETIPSQFCENTVGVQSHRMMILLNYNYDSRDNLKDYVDISIEICKFDKSSNSNRAFTGSTISDAELFSLSAFSGNSDEIGSCFMTMPTEMGYPTYNSVSLSGCVKDQNIIRVAYVTDLRTNSEKILDIMSELMDQTIKKMNDDDISTSEYSFQKIVGYDIPQTPQININQEDSSTDDFSINVVKCEDPNGFGDYIEVEFGIRNNLSEDYTLDLQILLLDSSGNVLEVERTYADTKSGRTIFDDRLISYQTGTSQCLVEIVEKRPAYP